MTTPLYQKGLAEKATELSSQQPGLLRIYLSLDELVAKKKEIIEVLKEKGCARR